jgi:hypothetical protein
MATIARTLSRVSGIDVDVESLKAVVAVSSIGLLVSLLFAMYGFDVLP